jgi:hypothetical protein
LFFVFSTVYFIYLIQKGDLAARGRVRHVSILWDAIQKEKYAVKKRRKQPPSKTIKNITKKRLVPKIRPKAKPKVPKPKPNPKPKPVVKKIGPIKKAGAVKKLAVKKVAVKAKKLVVKAKKVAVKARKAPTVQKPVAKPVVVAEKSAKEEKLAKFYLFIYFLIFFTRQFARLNRKYGANHSEFHYYDRKTGAMVFVNYQHKFRNDKENPFEVLSDDEKTSDHCTCPTNYNYDTDWCCRYCEQHWVQPEEFEENEEKDKRFLVQMRSALKKEWMEAERKGKK